MSFTNAKCVKSMFLTYFLTCFWIFYTIELSELTNSNYIKAQKAQIAVWAKEKTLPPIEIHFTFLLY